MSDWSSDVCSSDLQDANAVLAVEDGNPAALYVAGAASYGLKQYEQALRHLSRYVATTPGDANGRKLLAATQVQMGDADAARRPLGDVAPPEDPDYLSPDRTSVGLGKCVSVRVDLGGRRIIKKKK